jgi:hypothetical protein
MFDAVAAYLDEIQDLECAPLLGRFVRRVLAIEPALEPEVGTFGLRFRDPRGIVCEISVFGALFVVRLGRDQAVEYRVRTTETACDALDTLLRRLVETAPGAAVS